MHFIRRAALRAASSPSTSLISKSRSINISSPFLLRSKVQNSISSSPFRRFASDEATTREEEKKVESADGEEHGTIRSAIDSATETVSTYAADAAESLTHNAEMARESISEAAGTAAGYAARPKPGFGAPSSSSGPDGRVIKPAAGIYIGNLLFDITEEDIKREFQEFGNIQSVTIASDARGLSKGFGYVTFESIDAATAAIQSKNNSILEGRRIIVNYMAKSTRASDNKNEPTKTLFIGNLAFEMSDADLNKLFRDVRNVIDVRVAIDRRTGQPRGFAHADFIDVESATKAFEQLTDKEIYGRKLRVDYSVGRVKTSGL